MISKDEILPILKQIPLFGGISESELDTIIALSKRLQRDKGSILFFEEEPSTEIYIILSGKVKIVNNYKKGALEIRELSTGESLGEASLIGIQPHSATAVVIEDASLMVITRNLLNELQKNDCRLFSHLLLNIARELARRVQRYSNYIKELESSR